MEIRREAHLISYSVRSERNLKPEYKFNQLPQPSQLSILGGKKSQPGWLNVINISRFSWNSPPWQNLMSILLFPHIRFHLIFQGQPFLDSTVGIHTMYHKQFIFPSCIPSIRMIVVHPSDAHAVKQLFELIATLAT